MLFCFCGIRSSCNNLGAFKWRFKSCQGFHTAGYEVPKNALLIDMVELIACALFALLSAGFGGLIIITRELNAIAYTSANFYMNADKPVLSDASSHGHPGGF